MCQRSLCVIIRLCPAVLGVSDILVFHHVIFPGDHRPFPTDKQDRLLIVQQTDLIRRQKFPAGLLEIGGITAVPAFRLPVGIRIQRLLSQQFGDVFMTLFLIAAQV